MNYSPQRHIGIYMAALLAWVWLDASTAFSASFSVSGATFERLSITGRGGSSGSGGGGGGLRFQWGSGSAPESGVTEDRQKRQAADQWAAQGRQAMDNQDWDRAIMCLLKSLDECDDKDIRTVLTAARVAQADAIIVKRLQEEKGQTLLDMSVRIQVLLAAVAETKSSVVSTRLGRSIQTGAEASFSQQGILTDASVVDLRHVRTGIVDLTRLKSPYTEKPPPVAAGRLRSRFADAPPPIIRNPKPALSDEKMAKLASILTNAEIFGMASVSARDVGELLGSTMPGGGSGSSTGTTQEHTQIKEALDRFTTKLMQECNLAIATTKREFDEEPQIQALRARARDLGSDSLDSSMRAMLDRRSQEAQKRLFARFSIAQDMAIRELGVESTHIFKQTMENQAK